MAWLAVVLAGGAEIFGVINIKRMTEKKWDAGALFNYWIWRQSFFTILRNEDNSNGNGVCRMDRNRHSRRNLIRNVYVWRTKELEKDFLHCPDYCFGCWVKSYFVNKGCVVHFL